MNIIRLYLMNYLTSMGCRRDYLRLYWSKCDNAAYLSEVQKARDYANKLVAKGDCDSFHVVGGVE